MQNPSEPLETTASPRSSLPDCPVQSASEFTSSTKRRRSLEYSSGSAAERSRPSGTGEEGSETEHSTSSGTGEESSEYIAQDTLEHPLRKHQRVTTTRIQPLPPHTHTTLPTLKQPQRTHRYHKFTATGIRPLPPRTHRRNVPHTLTESFASMDLQQRQKLEAMFPGGWIGQCGANAYITVPIDSIRREVLYTDVRGPTPDDHPPLGEIDMEDEGVVLPYPEYQTELQRAEHRSKQPIPNAPPYFLDLPWDIMHDISVEELIVYFPNHVLCWPGLALMLRVAEWDMLFNRTANLINIARGSDLFDDRRYRHAEPLPCMMKVQKAVQELEPKYRLEDHDGVWMPLIPPEYVMQVKTRKPRALEGKQSRVVTLEEIGGYVRSHPFDNRPFSMRVRKTLAIQYDRTITDPLVRNVFNMDHPNPNTSPFRTPAPGPRNASTGTFTTRHESTRRTHDRRSSTLTDFEMTDAGEFADVEDNYFEAATPSTPVVPTRQSSCSHGPGCTRTKCTPCKNGSNCRSQRQGRCKFRHDDHTHAHAPASPAPTATDRHQGPETANPETSNSSSSQRVCRFGANCRNKSACHFSHPEDESNSNSNPQPAARCPYAERCTRSNCFLTHPQGTSQNPSQNPPHSSTQRPHQQRTHQQRTHNSSQPPHSHSQPSQDPKSTRLCTFLPNCRRAECAFGHPTPANLGFQHVKFAQECRYAAQCTNRKCKGNHPSPAAAGKEGGGDRQGGRGDGNGQGQGGRGNGHGNGQRGGQRDGRGDGNGQGQGGRGDGNSNSNGNNNNHHRSTGTANARGGHGQGSNGQAGHGPGNKSRGGDRQDFSNSGGHGPAGNGSVGTTTTTSQRPESRWGDEML